MPPFDSDSALFKTSSSISILSNDTIYKIFVLLVFLENIINITRLVSAWIS
jgi:H+-transporting ATPase